MAELGKFPPHVIGVLSPLAGSDTMPWGIYKLLGPDYIVVSTSLKLASFKPEDIGRAVASIDAEIGHLVSRGADVVLQSGTPLGLSLGPAGLLQLVLQLHEKTGLPVLSSALNAVEAARAVDAKKIVVANKWNEDINRQLGAFLAHWDIELIASSAQAQEPAHFQSADLRECAKLAYSLGRAALEGAKDADALFIGGGAWLVEPAVEQLEREFGKPVISSLNGAVRGILKALGKWRAFPKGSGRVLEVE